jgi:tetratricopeptide (TPR) repeat protein
MFRETKFIDAVAEYERALKTVEDPIIHYNLGLAYSKVFKPGVDKPMRLGIKDTFVCDTIPNTKIIPMSVCVKDGERRFDDCDGKTVCASSYECKQVDLCTLEGPQLADAAATHFQAWLKANPSDDDTRKQMTQVWIDSGQFKLAIDYWKTLLDAKPNDGEIMGNLAGINLKAGDWRTSIEWYIKVANAAADTANKVAAYQFIGNVAWSKLNSKSLTAPEVLELADKGIGALQMAAALAPKNPKLFGLQASIYNFRALAHGASWAAALDRASAQDLQRISRVLAEEAKKAAGGAMPSIPTPPTPAPKAGG